MVNSASALGGGGGLRSLLKKKEEEPPEKTIEEKLAECGDDEALKLKVYDEHMRNKFIQKNSRASLNINKFKQKAGMLGKLAILSK